MLDIGWTELLVIAVVLIVVVGPKDLPPMLRAFGKMTANLRKMAGDFRTQFDQALREADMDDVRQTISDAQRFNPANAIREAINPLRDMGNEIRNDLQKATAVPSLTDTDTKAEDEEASSTALDPLLPMPELPPLNHPTSPATTPAAPAATASVSPAASVPSAAPVTTAAAMTAPSSTEKKPRAPRKPKTVAGEAAQPEIAAAKAPTKRTRAPAKAAAVGDAAPVADKPATRARKKPATPKDNA